ncbi:hypothetical protein V6L78_24595 [Pseudomonas canadensis]|uniref:hypothetical protein n=1 Tax=Pseudomonas canadensis TaxID=915099 RepID=UPI0030CCA17B
MRRVYPGVAELAAAIGDALDAELVYGPEVVQEMIYFLCRGLLENPRTGGQHLLTQLKMWYLEGALSQTAFSILMLHATALIDACIREETL